MRHRRPWRAALGGALVALVPAALVAGAVVVPHAFKNGEVADAAQMNANNAAFATAIGDNDSRLDAIEADYLPTSGGAMTGSLTDIDDTISFASNPAGGIGDTASIRFAGYGSGEQTELLLAVGNDPDDRIRLAAPGGVFLACRTGFVAVADGRLCVENTLRGPALIHTAIATCQQLTPGGTRVGARVCTHGDLQQACGTGLNPYGAASGWYGDHGQAASGDFDDEYLTWNNSACAPNNDGPAQHSTASLNFRCCY